MSEDTFVIEAGSSVRRRRAQRRALIILLTLLLMLFFAFWYAWSYYKDARDNPATPQVCLTAAPPTSGTASTVNVYNATGRNGLAASTAAAMKSRGFVIGKVANDPLKKAVKGSAEIRSGKAGATQAKQVAANVAGSTVVVDARTDASVDLVLGNAFNALSAKAAPPATPSPAVTCR